MEILYEDNCPKCGKKLTVYVNKTAYCRYCNNHFDWKIKFIKK